jgi:hypothetical protein
MILNLLYRLALVATGILLLVLVRTSDVSTVVALALLTLAAYDIFRGLRGDRSTPEQRELAAVEREAQSLSRTDPVAADRLLDTYFERAGERAERERAERERAELRVQASLNLQAAKRLAKMLREEMDGHRIMRERFLSRVSPEERDVAEATIDKREQQTQLELNQLEGTILRLKG